MLHGFTGSIAHLRPLGDRLYDDGYTILGINLPGHATSEQDMGRTGRSEWLQAARDAVQRLRLQCKSVTACGLSMGGVLALLLAEEELTDACITISAPMPAKQRMLPLAGVLQAVHPRTAWRDDEQRRQTLDQKYDKGYTGFPTGKGKDLFDLIRHAEKHLERIHCPLLAVQSTGDHSIDPKSADTIVRNARSKDKEKLLLADAPHVCTISDKLPEITHAIDVFMQKI